MTTAIDTSVLLDVFTGDPKFGFASAETVRGCLREGRLIACDAVWAEITSCFPTVAAAKDAMAGLGVGFDATGLDTALHAGSLWRQYRARGGKRARVAADFLIGAHAAKQADCLLTRDRGFYKTYFKKLRLVDPARS